MKEDRKKIFAILVPVILILSAYFVITQYQIAEITEDDAEKLPLLVKIFSDEATGTVPFQINLTSLVLYYEGSLEYRWDFGDNETSSEMNLTHIYNESGSYTCKLTVTDGSGEKGSDSIEIMAKNNEPPSVGMKLSRTTSPRKYVPMLPMLANFQKGRLWETRLKSGKFPQFIMNMEGIMQCEAQVNDPEGDEIVSYEWKLEPPPYQKLGGTTEFPTYYFNGSNITFPLVYTYREGKYYVTLKAVDSAGNEGFMTSDFEIRKSALEDIKGSFNSFRVFVWPLTLKPLFGETVANFIDSTVWPSLEKLPVAQLTLYLVLTFQWTLDLNKYIDDFDLMPTFKNILEKHTQLRPIVKNLLVGIQDRIKNRDPDSPAIDTIQKLLEDLGLANKRPELTDPKPENNHDNIEIDTQKVSITVTDPEGDPFDVSISGDYVNDINYPLEQYNGTFDATLITPLPYDTDVCWHVNVSFSQDRWVNKTYMFKTRWS